MKKVGHIGVLALCVAACATEERGGAPPVAPNAAGGAPAPGPTESVPPPSAFGHPGYVYYGAPQAAPAPQARMPAALSRMDAMNVAHLQAAKTLPRRCNVPQEVADGVFVHVDCYPYQRVRLAVKHASAQKLAMMRLGRVRWNTSIAPMAGAGAGRTTMRGGAPPGAMGGAMGGAAPGAMGGAASGPENAQPTPDLVDHRLNGLEGPVKDQGDVGACTAFALSAVVDNSLRRANQNITTSPEHVWAHYATPTMEDAASGNLNKGIAPFEVLPYSGKESCELTRDITDDCGETYGVYPNTAQNDAPLQQHLHGADLAGAHRIVSFEELEARPVNVDELVSILASGADVWAGFNVDSSVWVNRRMQNFVIPDWSHTDGGHAVALSGYRRVNGGLQFLIHNSWGPKWGDGGYAWVSQAMVQRFMDTAYKVRTDVDAGSPTSPIKPKTDEDCAGDQVIDGATGQCVGICPDQSHPTNGQCANGPAPPSQGPIPLPQIPPGWQIPGLQAIPGWGQPAQPNSPGAQPGPASSTQPPPAQPPAQPGAWQIPSAWPSAWPQLFPPPPTK